MNDHQYINMSNMTMNDLKHLTTCDDCAIRLADYVEAHRLLTAPKNMKEAILEKSKSLDRQMASQNRHIFKKRELFCYSLKVSFAAVFAITMLVLPQEGFRTFITASPGIHIEHAFSLPPLHEGAERINSIFNEFKYQLFQREVSSDDK